MFETVWGLKRKGTAARRFAGQRGRCRPAFESLEARLVPALGNPAWVSAGPAGYGGSVNAVAVDPTNADRVFVASVDGGVWRSTNATTASPTWAPLTDQLPYPGTTDVAFSPLDTTRNTLFVGTGKRSSDGPAQPGPPIGLYKTSDAGDAAPVWSQLGQSTFTGLTITNVVPTSLMGAGGQVLLVSTQASPTNLNTPNPTNVGNTGLYRSTDGGASWTLLSGATGGLPQGDVSQVVGDPGNANRFYAAVPGQGVYISNDGGATWAAANGTGTNVLANVASTTRIRLAVHSDPNNDVVYASLIGAGGALTGVFRSPDQGANWAALGLPPAGNISGNQGNLHASIVADPTDPNTVYIGGSVGDHFRGVFAAAGTTWDDLDQGPNNPGTHPDSRNMVFDPNGNLLEVDDGGIYRLTNPSNDPTKPARIWTNLIGNMTATETENVSYDSVNHVVFGGAQDNGTPLQGTPGNTTTYSDASGGDGEISGVDNGSAAGSSIHYTSWQGGMFRTTYNGSNTASPAMAGTDATGVPLMVNGIGKPLTALGQNVFFSTTFVVNQVDPRRLLFGSSFLYESTDQGNTLVSLGGVSNGRPQGAVGSINALVYGGFLNGQGNADVAYVGTSGIVVSNGQVTNVPTLLLRSQAGGTFNPVAAYQGVTVSFSGGGGTGASGTGMVSTGQVTGLNFVNSGSGYTTAPTITFSSPGPGGTTATAKLTIGTDGTIDGYSIVNAGSGYTATPTATITGGGGTGGVLTPTFAPAGQVFGVNLNNAGSGYTTAPTVTITGGAGTGATGTVSVNPDGTLGFVTLTNGGSGYNPNLGARVTALATDPRDWRILYVADRNGHVWRSANATDPNTPFVDITGNLGSVLLNNLDTFAVYAPSATAPPVLFVGGQAGVAATADPTQGANTTWSRFGTGLPNALVTGLTYNATDNVLAASTLGRGFFAITPLSDAAGLPSPVLAPATSTATFTQGGNPVALAPALTISDTGSANLSSATLTLTNPQDGMNEALAVNTAGTNITAAPYNPTSGQLVLSGTDTLADYQKVLQSATYADTATTPMQAPRTIAIVVGDGFASSNRATAIITVGAAANGPTTQTNQTATPQVMANGAPMAVNQGMTVTDSTSATLVSAQVTISNLLDPGDEVLAVDTTGTRISASYDPDTGVLTLSGTDTVAHYQQVLDSLTYEDTAAMPDISPRLLTVATNDGTHTSLKDPLEIDLVPVVQAPVLGSSATFTLDPESENDPNPAGTYVADLLAGATPADAITEADPNVELGIAVVGTDNRQGSWQFTTDGGTTWQAFNAPSLAHATLLTPDDSTLVRFVPAANLSGTVAGGLQFRLWDPSAVELDDEIADADGQMTDTTASRTRAAFSSAVGTANLAVAFVNQPPSFTAGPNLTVSAAAGPQTLAGFASRISPGAPNQVGQQLTFQVSNNNNSFFAVQPAITPEGTLTFTPSPSAAGTAVVTVLLHNSGGTANGGRDTAAPASFTITFPPTTSTASPASTASPTRTASPATTSLPRQPLALGRVFQFHRGQLLTVGTAEGLLHGASMPGRGKPVVVLERGPSHGRLLLRLDGSFLYNPDAHFTGSDSFTFRVINSTNTASSPAVVVLSARAAHAGAAHPPHAKTAERHALPADAVDRVFSQHAGRRTSL